MLSRYRILAIMRMHPFCFTQNRNCCSGVRIIFTAINQISQHKKSVKTISNRVKIHFHRRVNARPCHNIGKAKGPSTRKSMINTIQGLSPGDCRIRFGSGTT